MAQPPLNIMVGSSLQLLPEAGGGSLPVTLIGYLEGHSVLVSHPTADDGQLQPLVAGDRVEMRFESGDSLFSFESRVERVCEQPFPYLHLSYPEGIQSSSTRRAMRVPVNDMAMMLVMEDAGRKLSVALADISLAGARLVSTSRLGDVGDRFSIEIPHHGHQGNERVILPCEIRYVRDEISANSGKRVHHHGVEFTGLSKRALVFIQQYIGDKVAERRGA